MAHALVFHNLLPSYVKLPIIIIPGNINRLRQDDIKNFE